MPNYHLDYETFSAQTLRDVGVHRYISDPSADILMLAIAKEDEEPCILLTDETMNKLQEWADGLDCFEHSLEAIKQAQNTVHVLLIRQREQARSWLRELSNPDSICWAHNAPFEMAVTRWLPKLFDEADAVVPQLEQWRCTMALAMRAGLPASLSELAKVLKLPEQKDTEGKRLLKKFANPRPAGKLKGSRIMPAEEPDEFMRLIEYCLQDIRTERAVHKALKPFEFKGALLEAFKFDARLNHRGIPVNVKALRSAKKIIEETVEIKSQRFREITGLNPTQRDKVQNWLKDRGYDGDDMTALSVKRAMAKLDDWASDETKEALTIKQELSFAATSKVDAMLDCQIDGRVYGTMQFYGAGTGRWAGRLIQPQNFKRPTYKYTKWAYASLCDGSTYDAGSMEDIFGPPLEVLSSCIRHFIQLPKGKMLDVDYSNIEARVVCWLAGQEDALEQFRLGIDKYRIAASGIFGILPGEIGKESIERFIGKMTVLGCGFGMGWKKFMTQCKQCAESLLGVTLTLEKSVYKKAVKVFRETHPKVVSLWWASDRAARAAIESPGKRIAVEDNPYLSFSVVRVAGIPFLLMHLPSGRSLAYPWPEITPCKKPVLDEDGEPVLELVEDVFGCEAYQPKMRDSSDITFYGPMEAGVGWDRVKTYGGKLVENATQAVAFDLMAHGALNAEREGMCAFVVIHDQMLCEPNGHTIEELCKAVTSLPSWAAGIPLAAEGKEVPYYKK